MADSTIDQPALALFADNTYSQHGEDGILEKIFEIIVPRTRLCVEFGAWDGFYLSNTANLWTKGWRGVLIEAERERFKVLRKNVETFNCRAVHALVGLSVEDRLEAILEREGIKDEIDLLSIDIDGDDYHVFASLENIRPRVIVCEFNPTIPPHISLVQEPGGYFGCSSLALVNLAEEKGYRLLAITGTNCIFIRDEEFHLFAGFETSFSHLAARQSRGIYLITGYAGDYVLSGEPIYGCSGPSSQTIKGKHYLVDIESQMDFIVRTILNHPLTVATRLGRYVARAILRRR